MKNTTYTWAIFCTLAVHLAAYNLWPFLWKDCFYQLQALEITGVGALLVRLTEGKKWPNKGACIFCGWAFLELLDECGFFKAVFPVLRFDPMQYEASEYTLALLIFVSCIVGRTGLRLLFIVTYLNFSVLLTPVEYGRKKRTRGLTVPETVNVAQYWCMG